jgi:SWI/SNF-related matrix-associated actin-dependent regulator of chromatin subfamily D
MDSLFFPHLPNFIMPHLQPLPPLQLPYTIRVDRAYISPDENSDSVEPILPPSAPTIYDILVPLSDPLREAYLRTTRNPTFTNTLASIAAHDDYLALTVQAVAHAKAKHAFFTSLSRDPVGFVRRWTSSQKRDLEVILGEATRGGGEDGQGESWRRGGKEGVWGSVEARESVGLWLARPKAH